MKLHPTLQVATNRRLLMRHTALFRDRSIAVRALAYLHNAYSPETNWLTERTEADTTLITGAKPALLRAYLLEHLAPASGAEAAERLLGSEAVPDSALQYDFSAVMRGTRRFVLIDEQRSSYQAALEAVGEGLRDGRHRAVIVEGVPGSGKSVIGVELLRAARERGLTFCHVVASTACRDTFKKHAHGFTKQFMTLNGLHGRDRDAFDLAVCDEAQSLPTRPPIGPAIQRGDGDPSLDVLLTRARTAVFLLDGGQATRPREGVTADEIEKRAKLMGHDVRRFTLGHSFRAGGSPTYATWVRRLMDLGRTPIPWIPDDEPFMLQVADSPRHMEELLERRQEEGFHARITAGYCWDWSTVPKGHALPLDVRIGSWHKPWNARHDQAGPGAPVSTLWATGDGGFGQIGCVYTAKGLEYQWGGVIFGPDLVWRDDRWTAVLEASHDRKLKALCRDDTREFERCVRNAYRVLLTRSLVGTVVYSTDDDTQKFLKRLIGEAQGAVR
jgi:uncharacterized protein